jgi:glucose-6-phosphate dehydrogenase assembly protein OpcA
MIDPSLASMSSINGVDTLQPDFPQHMTLSPKMAALWKNLMTQGSNAPEQTQSLPELTKAESDREADQQDAIDLRFSSTGAASGQLQPTGYGQQTSSSRLDSVQQTGASTASDSHFGTEGRRPQDAITEAKHLISDLVNLGL